MTIRFNVEGKSPLTPGQLSSIASSICENLKESQSATIGLGFVSSKTIRQLNKHYAGNDFVTDVLSFQYNPDNHDGILGDIAVCEDIAKVQAKEHNQALSSELTLLVIHGALHLLGYDHQDNKQIASLDKLQGDIMKALNYEYRDFKWSQ